MPLAVILIVLFSSDLDLYVNFIHQNSSMLVVRILISGLMRQFINFYFKIQEILSLSLARAVQSPWGQGSTVDGAASLHSNAKG